jgi:hypothetical protein
MNDEQRRLAEQAERHREEMQRALGDLRVSAVLALGAVRYLRRSSRLIAVTAVAGIAGIAVMQWRRGNAPRALIAAGLLVDAARLWSLRRAAPATARETQLLPAPPRHIPQ